MTYIYYDLGWVIGFDEVLELRSATSRSIRRHNRMYRMSPLWGGCKSFTNINQIGLIEVSRLQSCSPVSVEPFLCWHESFKLYSHLFTLAFNNLPILMATLSPNLLPLLFHWTAINCFNLLSCRNCVCACVFAALCGMGEVLRYCQSTEKFLSVFSDSHSLQMLAFHLPNIVILFAILWICYCYFCLFCVFYEPVCPQPVALTEISSFCFLFKGFWFFFSCVVQISLQRHICDIDLWENC